MRDDCLEEPSVRAHETNIKWEHRHFPSLHLSKEQILVVVSVVGNGELLSTLAQRTSIRWLPKVQQNFHRSPEAGSA